MNNYDQFLSFFSLPEEIETSFNDFINKLLGFYDKEIHDKYYRFRTITYVYGYQLKNFSKRVIEDKKKIENIAREYHIDSDEFIKQIEDNQLIPFEKLKNEALMNIFPELRLLWESISKKISTNFRGYERWNYQLVLLFFKYKNFIKSNLCDQKKHIIDKIQDNYIKMLLNCFNCDESLICVGDYDGQYKIVDGKKVCKYTCILGNVDFGAYPEIEGLGDLKMAISINLKGSNITEGFNENNMIYVLGSCYSINDFCIKRNELPRYIYLKGYNDEPANLICNMSDLHEKIFSYMYNKFIFNNRYGVDFHSLNGKLLDSLKELNSYPSFSEDYYFNFLLKSNFIDIFSHEKYDENIQSFLDDSIKNIEQSNNLSNILQRAVDTFSYIINYYEVKYNLKELYGDLPYYDEILSAFLKYESIVEFLLKNHRDYFLEYEVIDSCFSMYDNRYGLLLKIHGIDYLFFGNNDYFDMYSLSSSERVWRVNKLNKKEFEGYVCGRYIKINTFKKYSGPKNRQQQEEIFLEKISNGFNEQDKKEKSKIKKK